MKRLVKRFVILLFILFFLLSALSVEAGYLWDKPIKEQIEEAESSYQNISPKDAPLYDAVEYYEKPENKPSYGERFIAGIGLGFAKWGFNALGMEDATILVFGKNPRASSGDTFMTGGTDEFDVRGEKLLGIFNEPLFVYISLFYERVERLLPIPLVIVLSFIGLLMIAYSNNQEGRSKIKDYIQAFIVALVSLKFSVYLFIFIANSRNLLTDWIWYFIESIGVEHGLFVDMIWGTGKAGFDGFVNTAQSIGVALLALLALFMSMILNYQYKMMMYIVAFLILAFPVVTTMSIFPKFRHSIIIWWEEFLANVFMPVAHAITIAVFFMVLSAKEGLWAVLPFFFGMPVIVNLFRKLVGIQSGGGIIGAMGTTLGLTALMRMGSMFNKNKTSSKVTGESGILDTNTENYKNPSKTSFNKGISSYKNQSFGSRVLNTSRKVAGKTIRAASSIGGMGIGATVSAMATGNPMIGAFVGAKVGHVVGKGIGKTGQTIGDVGKFGKEAYSNYKENGMSVLDTIQQRHVQGDAGALNRFVVNAGWGAERMANRILGKVTGKQPFTDSLVREEYLTTNRDGYQNNMESMEKLQPEIETAKENLSHIKSKYSSNSYHDRYDQYELKKAEEHLNRIQNEYNTHKKNAEKLKENLTNYNQMKQHIQQFKDTPPSSSSRGRL